jgi:hypothetical protein
MTSHVCFEFSKDIFKCRCARNKRRSSLTFKDKLSMNDKRKPIWMHSGLFFRASSNIGSTNYGSSNLENRNSTIKDNNNSLFKIRGNHLTIANTLV